MAGIKNGRLDGIKKALQQTMWKYVGIIRSRKGLNTALNKIKKLEEKLNVIKAGGINKKILELENMLLVGKIITVSSMRRKESRGTHFIEEYPERHDNIWMKHLVIDKKFPKFR